MMLIYQPERCAMGRSAKLLRRWKGVSLDRGREKDPAGRNLDRPQIGN